MNSDAAQRLLALNRQFYTTCAAAFARTRGANQAGLLPSLPFLPASPIVLDLGCGQARLARWLAGHRANVVYIGLDASAPLLHAAAARSAAGLPGVQAQFVLADVAAAAWTQSVPPLLPVGVAFDAIYALALLHHLPGFNLRAAVLRQAAHLLAPAGALIVSYWQFMEETRWRQRQLPWETIGLTAGQVEPGDALLDWRRDGQGLRYVHHVTPAEAADLAAAAGLQVVASYHADGRSKRLNFFQILRLLDVQPR